MDELWKTYLDTRSLRDRDALIEAIRGEVFRRIYQVKWGCGNRGEVESEVNFQVTLIVCKSTESVPTEAIEEHCKKRITRAVRKKLEEKKQLWELTERFGTPDTRKWG
jgi:hypothetical protein